LNECGRTELEAQALKATREPIRCRRATQYRELIAAESGNHIRVAKVILQHLGKQTQHVIACLMAVIIVDALEVIQIDANEHCWLITSAAQSQNMRGEPNSEAQPPTSRHST
jgi:hypothetical protein